MSSGLEEDAIPFIEKLVKEGRKVGIFSCEDPYNTPFHLDVCHVSKGYLQLVPRAGGVVIPESVDLGLQAKGINAWGIFGHYGNVHSHEVCAAINALGGDYSKTGPDFKRHLDRLKAKFYYNSSQALKENIIRWVKQQYDFLAYEVKKKQKELIGAVQDDIIIFGGIVYNSDDGKSYESKILFILADKSY